MRIVEAYQYEMFPPNSLYHTTSPGAAFDILAHHELRPKTAESFVSFSLMPHLRDIQAHGAVLVFDLRALYGQLEPVEYTDAWAREHPDEVRYIAGEGWSEQFEYTPDDDFDDDDYEAAYADAELESFFQKAGEDEWISLRPGRPVRFTRACVTGLILDDVDNETRTMLGRMGYDHLKLQSRF